jgi:hypothetical protein
MGAMTVMMAPPPSCAARDLDWSAGDWWAKARPPLWQYLVVCVKRPSKRSHLGEPARTSP